MPLSLLFKLAPYLVAIGLLVGVFFYGVNVGKTECQKDAQIVVIEGTKSREQINHENKTLEHSIILKRLDDGGWLRND